MRLVTRGDLDGLACAVLFTSFESISEILLVHPQDITTHQVEITGDDIIANLPYNVGTPLLIQWLKADAWRGEMALMFQKEVAERTCARAGDPHYGRLAVLTAAVCDAVIAFTLPPGAFRPPPKVDSAVAVFRPLAPDERFCDLDSLEKVTTAAFGQRRKMLRAALKSLAKTIQLDTVEWLDSCDIDPTARAETLTQAQFRALARKFGEARQCA